MSKIDRMLVDYLLDCIEVEWEEHNRILRIYLCRSTWGEEQIDITQESIDLATCAKASKILVAADLVDSLVGDDYTVEVSSPGLERPLRRAVDFRRCIGKSIAVVAKISGQQKKGRGSLAAVLDSDEIVLDTTKGEWIVPLSMIDRAHVIHKK